MINRIIDAAPTAGGVYKSFVPELLVFPVIYKLWKSRSRAEESETAWELVSLSPALILAAS